MSNSLEIVIFKNDEKDKWVEECMPIYCDSIKEYKK